MSIRKKIGQIKRDIIALFDYRKIKAVLNELVSLSDGGERVDIIFSDSLDYDKLDMYQKSHLRRYEYALNCVNDNDVIGDFACGTGYGSIMLSKKALKVVSVDINKKVIESIKKRYRGEKNIDFVAASLLDLDYVDTFDDIVSFETIEHLEENDIIKVLAKYNDALRPGGKLIFSVPYIQERSENAIRMGFHLTFYIDEAKIEEWLAKTGFTDISYKYQNYEDHLVCDDAAKKDFIICMAVKK